MRYGFLGIAGFAAAWTWGMVGFPPSTHHAVAADDALSEQLRLADREYRDAIAQARGELLGAFEAKLESARASPRLKASERAALVEQIEQERDAFRDRGRIPASPRLKDAVGQFRRALQKADVNGRRAFDTASRVHRERGEHEAESNVIEAWERLFVATADLEAFPERWIPLFNGRSLTGWSLEGRGNDAWEVDGGVLVARGGPDGAKAGFLLTERAFRDFVLAFEFQLEPDADSGVVIRAASDEPRHLELNLRSFRETPSYHGRLFWSRSGNARDGLEPRPVERANGPWDQAVIEIRGDLLRVTINGRLAHSTDLRWFAEHPHAVSGVRNPSGRIGFESNVGTARFRNIRVRGIARSAGDAGAGELPGPEDAAIPLPGRSYRVINAETGKALDVLHSSLLGGAPGSLVQAVVAERPSQAWVLRARRGRYQIVNRNSTLLINIPLGRQEDGNGLIQWPDQNGAGNELWALVPEGRAFRITSTDGLAVIVNDRGRVEVRTPQGNRNELWRFVPAGW